MLAALAPGAALAPHAHEQAWLDALPQQLGGALSGARDAAALAHATQQLLQAALAARPARSLGSAAPCGARVAPAGALAAHASRGLGACGDLARLWSAPEAAQQAAHWQRLLPVRPWVVAGTLRAALDGLHLEDTAGLRIQLLLLDAAAAAPLVDRAVLAPRWALPPAPHGRPVLEAHSLLALDAPAQAAAATGTCVAGVVVAVSPVLPVQAQTFAIVELRCCGDSRVRHVYLEGAALRLRALLAAEAGRPACVSLSALTKCVLFQDHAERRWPLLVASAATALSLHGCAPAAAPRRRGCACDTCLRIDTACFHAEAVGAAPAGAGLALQLRLLRGAHAGRELPLLLTQHLTGAPSMWQLPGVRPGATVSLLHAHPVLCGGVLVALGACTRTTLRVSAFSPLSAPAVPLLHTADALALHARCERADFADAHALLRLHAALCAKLPPLHAGVRRARDGDDTLQPLAALLEALAPGAAPPCRASLYEELLAPTHVAAAAAAAADARPSSAPFAPPIAALRAAAAAAWVARGAAAPRVVGAGWFGDKLDGAPPVRLVTPLAAVIAAAADVPDAPAVLLAWAQRSNEGWWLLADASGSLEAAVEGIAPSLAGLDAFAHRGACVLLRRGFVVAEGSSAEHAAGGAPLRIYVAFHAADATRVPALDAEPPPRASGPSLAAAPEAAAPAPFHSLLLWPPVAGAPDQVTVRGRVVGECVRSRPHILGPLPPGAPAPAPPPGADWGARMRLRDVDGRDTIDLYLDGHRCRLPPGVARGAVVTVRGVSRGKSNSSALYLRAVDASLFFAETAPRADWAAPPPMPAAALRAAPRLDALLAAAHGVIDRRQLRARVRVVNVMRLVLRWSCAHCGCDVAEAFARGAGPPPGMLFDDPAAAATWFGGGCAACAPAPSARAPGAVTLAVEASVLLEDGSAQAECWADGEPALQLLGLWGGARDGGAGTALAALAARHGRLTARVAWVHPDEWDGSPAAGVEVRGRAARPLGAHEAAPVVDVMQRAVAQPPVSLWATRVYDRADDAPPRAPAGVDVPMPEPAIAAAAAAAGGRVRVLSMGGRTVHAFMRPWPRLRAASVERLDARAEVAAALAAL